MLSLSKQLIYARLLWETFGYQLQAASKNQEVEAVLFFLDASFDPKKSPWHKLGRSGQAGLRVFYLDEVVTQLPDAHGRYAPCLVYPPHL